MKISFSWLAEYLDLPEKLSPELIAEKLTFAGFEVEGILREAAGLDKVVVGELLEVSPHPNAERLSLTRVNIGTEELRIVCGAKNIAVGQKVPVAVVGAVIPNGLEIKPSKIRGEASFGMLCSADELKLSAPEGAAGIFLLKQDAKIGQNFAEYLGKGDVIFEVNVTPNRGDALSHLGIARELSAIFNLAIKEPKASFEESGASPQISVVNQSSPEACPAYFCRYIEGVKIGPSPDWLVRRLESIGIRSINNVVDATSFVLFESGQPTHAFDADKLELAGKISIEVRQALPKEQLQTISHKDISLNESDLLIALGSGEKAAAALAGVMGGKATEVNAETRNVLLESAVFSPLLTRKSNRSHALMTDAAYRFERGVDPQRVIWALDRVTEIILETAGGRACSRSSSEGSDEFVAVKNGEPVALSRDDVMRLLGAAPELGEMKSILERLGARLEETSAGFLLSSPSWRQDLTIKEDWIEEIARIWGFDYIPSRVDFSRIPFSDSQVPLEAKLSRLRSFLVDLGFMEALHYSFSSREAEALVIGKEASESLVEMQGIQGKEFNVMKSSLAPGVLRTISTGLARGRKSISLFEIRPTFTKAQKPKENSNLETGVLESQKLAIAITGFDLDEDWEGINREATFFTIKGIVESLLASLGRKGFRYMVKDLPAMFHPGQAAGLFLGNRPLGFMGRVHPRIEKAIDLSQPVYLAEFDLNALFTGLKGTDRYRPFSRFPQVDRDFSATVEESVTAEKLRSIALEAGKPLTKDLRFFDVYRGERVPKGHVSYAFRITLQAEDHTLTDAEISGTQTAIMNALTKGVAAKFAGLS